MATIFFSWQADTPNRVGRSFWRPILEEVCAEISSDAAIDEAIRVDSDTQGIAGQPPIAETILNKIDKSAVFLADMTFTGARRDERPTPNPNVLIEYGWALKSLGHYRVICVMNTAYGKPGYDTLPFDLAHLRWPVAFELAEDATPEAKTKEKARLKKVLVEAIRTSLATVPVATPERPPRFTPVAPKDGPARFRVAGEAIGVEDGRFAGTREVYLADGPALWLRVMPENDPGKTWNTREMLTLGSGNLMPLLRPGGGYSYLRASDGIGVYYVGRDDRPAPQADGRLIDAVAFAFRSGEIWSIETELLQFAPNNLHVEAIEQELSKGAADYLQFLQDLGVAGPYRWKAGLFGVKGRCLVYPPRPGCIRFGFDSGPVCVADQIEADGEFVDGQPTSSSLLPFFQKLFDECGIVRPDYMPVQ